MSTWRNLAFAGTLGLAACAAERAPVSMIPPPAPATRGTPQPPPNFQWLYGSGEAAAASIQAYHGLRNYVLAAAKSRPRDSVVLAPGATLASPSFISCGDRPLAIVLDADETVLLNLGFEYDDASHPDRPYDDKRFGRWEVSGVDKVAPVPGAVTALRAIRDASVTVIFNSNRTAANADFTGRAIEGAGLGPARHGETLFLRGDVDAGSGKDIRRALISQRYCVIAMVGDQFGDFSDLLNERALGVTDRRRAGSSGAIANLWGNGWFLLPNPVYGPGVRGTFDEVFPADKRWSEN
jgi:5'-nucleotidase (lipoprotein e(P4) family)